MTSSPSPIIEAEIREDWCAYSRAAFLAYAAIAREPSEGMIRAYRVSLKQFIRELPESERATARNKQGGYRLHDENVKAGLRWRARCGTRW